MPRTPAVLEVAVSARPDGTVMRVEGGWRLARALGTTALRVNSFHHQALRDVAPGLAVVARAPVG